MSVLDVRRRVDPAGIMKYQRATDRAILSRFNKVVINLHQAIMLTDVLCISNREPIPADPFVIPIQPLRGLSVTDKHGYFMEWLIDTVSAVGLGYDSTMVWLEERASAIYEAGCTRALSELRRLTLPIPTENAPLTHYSPLPQARIHREISTVSIQGFRWAIEKVTTHMVEDISSTVLQGLTLNWDIGVIWSTIHRILYGGGTTLNTNEDNTPFYISYYYRMVSHTETMRIFHKAVIQTYRDNYVDNVNVLVEHQTQHDDSVCSECASLEGTTYSIDAAEDIIPVHPNCRCFVVPVVQ
jgi:SPP1 gp7 family putative phage head morphogenesis protein